MKSCVYVCVNGTWQLVSGNCPGGCPQTHGPCNNEGAGISVACDD
jgi:hypothetical protein